MSMSLQTTYNDTFDPATFGMLDSAAWSDKAAARNADVVSIPFATAVAFKPSGATTDRDVTLPANSTDLIKGIVHRLSTYARSWTDENGVHGQLDATGIVAGAIFEISRKGRMWVPCVTGCVPSDRLFVCYAAAGATYTVVGTLGNVAEASHTIDASKQAQWMSTAAATKGAWLEFDFTAKP